MNIDNIIATKKELEERLKKIEESFKENDRRLEEIENESSLLTEEYNKINSQIKGLNIFIEATLEEVEIKRPPKSKNKKDDVAPKKSNRKLIMRNSSRNNADDSISCRSYSRCS